MSRGVLVAPEQPQALRRTRDAAAAVAASAAEEGQGLAMAVVAVGPGVGTAPWESRWTPAPRLSQTSPRRASLRCEGT